MTSDVELIYFYTKFMYQRCLNGLGYIYDLVLDVVTVFCLLIAYSF